MDPIQQLKEVVREGRLRVEGTHRNEWPQLWEAIDRVVRLRFPNDYIVTAEQDIPKSEVFDLDSVRSMKFAQSDDSERVYIEVRHDNGRNEIMEVMRGQLAEDWESPEDDIYDTYQEDVPMPDPSVLNIYAEGPQKIIFESEATIEIRDIESIAGSDPKAWALWFQAFLEAKPNITLEELEQWFGRALSIGEIGQHPLIELEIEDGRVVSMRHAEDPEWDERFPTPLDGPDPEDPGF